jgi:hypothetical protein
VRGEVSVAEQQHARAQADEQVGGQHLFGAWTEGRVDDRVSAHLDQGHQPDLGKRAAASAVAGTDKRLGVGGAVRHVEHGGVPGHQP